MSKVWNTRRRALYRVLGVMAVMLPICCWTLHQMHKESLANEAKANDLIPAAPPRPGFWSCVVTQADAMPVTIRGPDRMLSSTGDLSLFNPAFSGVGLSLIDLRHEGPQIEFR